MPRHQIPSNEPGYHLAFKGKERRLSTPNATNLGIKGKATLVADLDGFAQEDAAVLHAGLVSAAQ